MTERKYEWQPIKTAPRDGTVIDVWAVVYLQGGRIIEDRRIPNAIYEQGAWRSDDDGEDLEWGPDIYGKRKMLTHWMPLPEPPKEPKK